MYLWKYVFRGLAKHLIHAPFTINPVSQTFEVGPVHVGAGKLFLIAGPCVIESEKHARFMAEQIQRITSDLGVPYIFKASYDKANRTSVKSFRGPGLKEGAAILGRIAKDTGLPVLTDIHEPAHAEIAAEHVDVLQIPAFLCRQTDLLVAAGKTGRAVNIKKGQFVAPVGYGRTRSRRSALPATSAFSSPSAAPALATTRWWSITVRFPSCAGWLRSSLTARTRCSSPRRPTASQAASRSSFRCWQRAAVAAGVDGLFLEVHDDPANAKSDGANALKLDLLKPLLETLLAIHEAARS